MSSNSGTELLVECDYNSDLLEPDTIRRWLGHYLRILDAMIVSPDVRVGGHFLDYRQGSNSRYYMIECYRRQLSGQRSPFTRLFEARARGTSAML